jgi:biopolymer transport protein ExbD
MPIRPRRLPEVPAASLSDIAFLLLVFFIATTIFPTEKGLALLLPTGAHRTTVPRDQVVCIHVSADGTLQWDDAVVLAPDLRRRIVERLEERPNTIFKIDTESEAAYAAFVEVLDQAFLGGAERISVSLARP